MLPLQVHEMKSRSALRFLRCAREFATHLMAWAAPLTIEQFSKNRGAFWLAGTMDNGQWALALSPRRRVSVIISSVESAMAPAALPEESVKPSQPSRSIPSDESFRCHPANVVPGKTGVGRNFRRSGVNHSADVTGTTVSSVPHGTFLTIVPNHWRSQLTQRVV